ncbi:hypothetical protein [Streptomyces sp. CoH17]|uniref:hypothetical protein n=1 Tax=Streptomyces sp. CoH17 TaxID=2992806 RepID=UPI002270917C|nr:hypothetical protein [Streptomyces sp. CoH17]
MRVVVYRSFIKRHESRDGSGVVVGEIDDDIYKYSIHEYEMPDGLTVERMVTDAVLNYVDDTGAGLKDPMDIEFEYVTEFEDQIKTRDYDAFVWVNEHEVPSDVAKTWESYIDMVSQKWTGAAPGWESDKYRLWVAETAVVIRSFPSEPDANL